jgi:predicted RNA-binding protein (virulence factor B family)
MASFNKVTFEEVDAKVDNVLSELTTLSNEIKQMEVNISADIRKYHQDTESNFKRAIGAVSFMWISYTILVIAMYFILRG